MERSKSKRAVLVVLLAASAPGVSALAQPAVPMLAGSDGFQTPAGAAELDFATQPIPADFFAPGSDPFASLIVFVGTPVETDPPGALGPVDTVVERLEDTIDLGIDDFDTIAIEIVALSLESVAPITVTFNGGQNPELWDVRVCLSPGGQVQGSMTITRTSPDGGIFSSSLPVTPSLTFAGPGGATEVLDCGVPGNCNLDIFEGSGNSFVIIGGPGGITRPSIGVFEFGAVQVNSDCDSLGIIDVTTQGQSNFQGGLADAGGGGALCDPNSEIAMALAMMTGGHEAFPPVPDTNGNGVPDICEGACCLPGGACNITIEKDCGGIYLGNETTCGPMVACCLPDNTCISPVAEACCTGPEGGSVVSACLGDSDGDGADDACVPPPQGCCWSCLGNATVCAAPTFQANCNDNWVQGANCGTNACGLGKCEKRACCLGDGNCIDEISVTECDTMGGQPLAEGDVCQGDGNEDGIDDACEVPIPTVSEWGLIVMTLVGLAMGTIMLGRRRRVTAG